ncbi:MAG: Asp-tRNA(Asn)/Glu-tRNA(Gln) amidotransferase subunit GatC [Nitrospirae bacterium]|nr:Asp-tRNA(Asn)/Glu-tRNA(Gln) amidotransferase subunit GatC [Nitrospirota bacterium]
MDISIDHLARLARLKLTEDEKPLYGEQLEGILHYMETLNGLDTTGIEPTSHVISLSNVMRDDTASPSLSREEALRNAPDRTDAFYRVPKIIE